MNRIKFISTVGGVMMAGAGSLGGRSLVANAAEQAMPSSECGPTPRQGEGPYLTPDSLLRSDIREDRPGVPVHFTLYIKDDFWCTPIEGAAVDVWHSDALGQYSGIVNELIDPDSLRLSGETNDMTGTSFLRGHQVSDANGKVEFTTIYPVHLLRHPAWVATRVICSRTRQASKIRLKSTWYGNSIAPICRHSIMISVWPSSIRLTIAAI